MSPPNIAHLRNAPQPIDLPPEISAFIDDAVARATAGATRRPVVTIVPRFIREEPRTQPRLSLPAKRARVPAADELALVGLLVGLVVGLLVAGWLSLLIGLGIAQAGERSSASCAVQAPSRAVSEFGPCARLPR